MGRFGVIGETLQAQTRQGQPAAGAEVCVEADSVTVNAATSALSRFRYFTHVFTPQRATLVDMCNKDLSTAKGAQSLSRLR